MVPHAEARLRDVLGERALERDIVGSKIATWLGKAAVGVRKMQRETPLSDDDLAIIKDAPSDPLGLTGALIDRKQPRWLMGWRDICRSTDERTVIASVLPRTGIGNKIPLMEFATTTAREATALIANLSSIPFDYLITHNPQPRPGRYGRSVSEGRWRARNDGQSSRKGRHAGA